MGNENHNGGSRGVTLYEIRNRVNGKVYFGKTARSVQSRWLWHRKFACWGKPWAISRAIRKYGEGAFDVRPIVIARSEEEANVIERFLIATFEAYKPSKGYNMTFGGDGISHPTETLKRSRGAASAAGARAYIAKHPDHPRFGHGQLCPQLRSDIDTDHVVRLYESGLSPRQIARKLEFTGVLRRLKKAGVRIRGRSEVQLGRPRHA